VAAGDEKEVALAHREGVPQGLRESARRAIGSLRAAVAATGAAPGLFGQERGDQLGAILGNVEQTFGGEAFYPSVSRLLA
jgi:hypothetical protein